MMNPATMHKNLGTLITAYQHPSIYKFLHVPVQSGDDDILQKMNRGYTAAEFTSLVHRFRKTIPTLTVSTDVIIGFPTETEEQFKRTIQVLQQVKPDIVNITRFSARPLTLAKTMTGRIPTHVVKERSRHITDVCAKLSLQKNIKHLRKTSKVLVTEKGKNNTVTGRTDSYKQVVLSDAVRLGTFVDVEILGATSSYLFGKLI